MGAAPWVLKRKNANRAAAAIKVRLAAPTAINAGAHKLARLLYRMLKYGKAYVETGQQT
jgi:hypothetical protein